MKFLKKFNTEDEYKDYMRTPHLPNVSVVAAKKNLVFFNSELKPLYFEALEDMTVAFSTNAIEYSLDNSTWEVLEVDTPTPTISAGSKVYFRASGIIPPQDPPGIASGMGTFTMSGRCNAGGSVMSMIYGEDYRDQYEIPNKFQFHSLFKGCPIVDASKLSLPATTITRMCYAYMFSYCDSLIAAPELPALAVAYQSYIYMFEHCTSLTTPPELPATQLDVYCYSHMFQGCTSLTTAPELPAKYAPNECYGYMFADCTSLVDAPSLPATGLDDACYGNMFENCTSLTTAPELSATEVSDFCYSGMFRGCTNLKIAPVLPATTLVRYCYRNMFSGCTALSYIKMLATKISAENCLDGWVSEVASEGTFVKNSAASWNKRGASGVPYGWTIEYAAA